MRRRGVSQPRSPADRCVAVTARFAIYRQFGRGPSQVYVDDMMRAAASGPPERRLSDNVFWRTSAEVGDHFEERAGGMLLMTGAMACHPIQLSAPRSLEVATDFGHADAVLCEDRKILDGLLVNGSVIEVSAHRSKAASSRLPDIVLAEDHPLVVTIRPCSPDGVQPTLPAARERDTAAAKTPPAPR
jgi:hypothetical protein